MTKPVAVIRFVRNQDVPAGERPDGCADWIVFCISGSDPQRAIFLSDAYLLQTLLYRQAYAWCSENIEHHNLVWYSSRLYLRNPEDAFAFKMAWC